jgi:hypothetical protein
VQDPKTPPAAPVPPTQKPFNNADAYAMRWTERALDLVNASKLKVGITQVQSIKVAIADGECPYCGDHMRDVRTLTAVTEGSDGVLGGKGVATRSGTSLEALTIKYEDVTFTCGCSVAHPGGPKGQTGCGTHFRLSVPVF